MIILFLYSIAALSIILGFVALLTQKIYIDKDTKQKIDFTIPFFGKIKTNYPALIFTILGFWLIYYVTDKSYPPSQINWVLEGYFVCQDSIKFDDETIYVHPSNIVSSLPENPNTKGKFRIDIRIDEDKSIEDVIEYFSYDHNLGGNIRVNLENELDKFNEGDVSSLIKERSTSSLNFKDLQLIR